VLTRKLKIKKSQTSRYYTRVNQNKSFVKICAIGLHRAFPELRQVEPETHIQLTLFIREEKETHQPVNTIPVSLKLVEVDALYGDCSCLLKYSLSKKHRGRIKGMMWRSLQDLLEATLHISQSGITTVFLQAKILRSESNV